MDDLVTTGATEGRCKMICNLTLRQYVTTRHLVIRDTFVELWESHTCDPPLAEVTDATFHRFADSCRLHRIDGDAIVTTVDIVNGLIDRMRRHRFATVAKRRSQSVPSIEELDAVFFFANFVPFPRCELKPVEWWQLLVVLAYTTAMNAADLFALRWESVDLEGKTITFRSAKTGRLDQFPLHPAAAVHLQAAREKATTPLVLCGMYRDLCGFRQAFHRIQLDAGVTMRSGLFGLRSVRKLAAMTMEAVQPGLGAILTQHTPRDIDDDIVPNQKRRQAIAEGLKRLDVPNDWFTVGGLPEDGDDIDDEME